MDNYDVVIERTVRDLFKSSPLNQIKRFKINKEKDIIKKEEELRNLILEKYPLLIKSISSLEQISSNLNDLQEIRKKFEINIEKMEKNIDNKNVYKFNKSLFMIDSQENQNLNDTSSNEDYLRDQLDDSWKYLNNKNYNSLLLCLINICKKLENDFVLDPFMKENFEFVLIEFTECLMKDFLSQKIWFSFKKSSESSCNISLENYFILFYGIFFMLKENFDKLNLSEFYLKLKTDENIINIFNEIFSLQFPPERNKNSILFYTLELIIKLILLKLSRSFNFISNDSHKKEEEIINSTEDIFMYFYELISILINIHSNLQEYNLEKEIDNDSDDSNEELNQIKQQYNYNENLFQNKNRNANKFNINKILDYLKLIFSFDDLNAKYLTFNKSVFKKFSNFIKNEVNKNINNKTVENIISFWMKTYDEIYKNYEKNSKMNDVGVYLDLNYEDNYEDNFNLLLKFIFQEKTNEHIKNYFTFELNKLDFENFENFSLDHYNPLIKIYSEIFSINKKEYPVTNKFNKIFIENVTKLLSENALSYLEKAEKIIKTSKEEKISAYVNFLVNLYSTKKMKLYLKELNFNQILVIINRISNVYLEKQFKEIESYMKIFKNFLIIENFMEDKCYESDRNNFNTNSLVEISNYLMDNYNFEELEFDDRNFSTEIIKSNILAIIAKNYCDCINSIFNKSEDILNKRIINDLLIINKALNEFSNRNISNLDEIKISINKTINNFSGEFNIDCEKEINNLNKLNENNFYNFFEIDQRKNSEIEIKIRYSFNQNIFNKSNSNKVEFTTKEPIPFNPRLNIHMLKKVTIDRFENRTNKSSTTSTTNSSSKLLEFRIDENYLSLKTNIPKPDSVNKPEVNSDKKIKPTMISNNTLTDSNLNNTNKIIQKTLQPQNQKDNSNIIDQSSNIKGYFGYFGGMLKENLSNIKGYMNANVAETNKILPNNNKLG